MNQGSGIRDVIPKKLASADALRKLMADYYHELQEASRSASSKVAWCTSVGPVELLRSLGFKVYFPENHAAMLGASRRATEFIPVANALGYSPEICSYLTSDLGAYLSHQTALTQAFGLKEVPRPDVLVYNTNQCRDVQDWFAFYQREFGVPLLGLETPRGIQELKAGHICGLVGQYQDLIYALEPIAGQRFDRERLQEVVASSYRCSCLWERVLKTATHRPSPFTFFDGTIHMGPAVVLRGEVRAEQYYQLLLGELEERLHNHLAAIGDEVFRLYWEGMPIWGKLREHAELFAHHGMCVVASTYCNSWIFLALDHTDPLVGLARAYAELFIVRPDSYKQTYLERLAREYDIDALIYHDAKTCPNNSNNRYGLPRRLTQRLGLPHVVLQGDLNDLRLFSAEQTRTQIEALMEQLRDRMDQGRS